MSSHDFKTSLDNLVCLRPDLSTQQEPVSKTKTKRNVGPKEGEKGRKEERKGIGKQ